MNHRGKTQLHRILFALIVLSLCIGPISGCRDVDTLIRELGKKYNLKFLRKKHPFEARDGITIRPGQLHRNANPNSEIIRTLPAETPVRLTERTGEWYRVRTRDGREGYLKDNLIGDEKIIKRTEELRQSIERMPVQAEGELKNKANFRLWPGRHHKVVDVLPPGKKVEMFERVVTLRAPTHTETTGITRGQEQLLEDIRSVSVSDSSSDLQSESEAKKDVWYKVKIEDGRIGFVYTHNLKFNPPPDIDGIVPGMRLLAWRVVSVTDDPDRGAVKNYVAAFTPMGKDPGCDFTRVYYFVWDKKNKRRTWKDWQYGNRVAGKLAINGILPITNFQYEGRSGFSLRRLHPTQTGKLVLTSFIYSRGRVRVIKEEEITDPREFH
jgi:hypothetical protein